MASGYVLTCALLLLLTTPAASFSVSAEHSTDPEPSGQYLLPHACQTYDVNDNLLGERDICADAGCDLGPLRIEDEAGVMISAYFCDFLSEGDDADALHDVLAMYACNTTSNAERYRKVAPCAAGTCTLGPLHLQRGMVHVMARLCTLAPPVPAESSGTMLDTVVVRETPASTVTAPEGHENSGGHGSKGHHDHTGHHRGQTKHHGGANFTFSAPPVTDMRAHPLNKLACHIRKSAPDASRSRACAPGGSCSVGPVTLGDLALTFCDAPLDQSAVTPLDLACEVFRENGDKVNPIECPCRQGCQGDQAEFKVIEGDVITTARATFCRDLTTQEIQARIHQHRQAMFKRVAGQHGGMQSRFGKGHQGFGGRPRGYMGGRRFGQRPLGASFPGNMEAQQAGGGYHGNVGAQQVGRVFRGNMGGRQAGGFRGGRRGRRGQYQD